MISKLSTKLSWNRRQTRKRNRAYNDAVVALGGLDAELVLQQEAGGSNRGRKAANHL
jgi:hypothetical protein